MGELIGSNCIIFCPIPNCIMFLLDSKCTCWDQNFRTFGKYWQIKITPHLSVRGTKASQTPKIVIFLLDFLDLNFQILETHTCLL